MSRRAWASRKGIGSGFFEGAVEIAQRPSHLRHYLAAELAQRDGFLGDGFDLRLRRGLRPGEAVEDGVAGVVETAPRLQRWAMCKEISLIS